MNIFKYGPLKAVLAVFAALVLIPMSFAATFDTIGTNIESQRVRMEWLKTEFYKEYKPVDENKITAFNLSEALESGVKFNEVAFIGTHNSYQIYPTEEYRRLYNTLGYMTFGIVNTEKANFNMDTLTNQFELGVRNVEIDIEVVSEGGEVSFAVSHDPVLDNTSSCYDFALALEEIKLWSDNNPGHLPISVLIEPKDGVLPVHNMKKLSLDYARFLDKLLREKLGDSLLTPKEVIGDYSSFKEMRENDGWPFLKDMLGKVIVILHPSDVSEAYVAEDESIKTQAMFPMVRYKERNYSYASFMLDNKTEEALGHQEETVEKLNLIVRTRADKYPSFSEERYEKMQSCKSQIITTDFPYKTYEDGNHVFSFDGYTVRLVK